MSEETEIVGVSTEPTSEEPAAEEVSNEQIPDNDESLSNAIVFEEHEEELVVEDPVVEVPVLTNTGNAILTDEYSTQSSATDTIRITLPSVNLHDLSGKLNNLRSISDDDITPELKLWRDATTESIDYYTVGALYQDRFYEKGSEFKQGVETKEGSLKSISPLKFKKSDGELKGEIAILKVSKILGIGDVVTIPLPHSGIWVTVKPPTETDLIEFYNSLFREKIILGRATFGLTLTNFSVHINNKLFDFILKHVHSINYGDIPKANLKNYLLIHDFPILAWGFACTRYPNGFEYQRACVNDAQQCGHIAKEVINLAKLLWVDNPSLSEAQKIILSEDRPGKLTSESYRKYLAEHTRVTGSTITTKNGIKIKLKIPTFTEYITDGLAWINKVNSAVENVLLETEDVDEDDDDSGKAKTKILNQYVKASILRQFNHFVDYIEFDDAVMTDRDTINRVLEVFSSDDSIREEITDGILKFKANTTIAIIGIPEYKCPNCKAEQNIAPVSDKFINVIPLDSMNLFFGLLTLQISKILEREV